MAGLMGDRHMEAKLASVRQGIKDAYRARLFDETKGCYADARFGDRLSPQVGEHGNMAAILFGLSEGAEARDIIRRLFVDRTQPYTRAEPFATAFTLRALDRAGHIRLAHDVIRERWGAWMADRGYASTPEEWGINGSWRHGRRPGFPQTSPERGHYSGFMRTLSHAWCAGPAEFLIKNTLGLEILEPGCRRVRVRPQDIGVDWRIAYPLPQGPLKAESRAGAVRVEAPDGVEMEWDRPWDPVRGADGVNAGKGGP